MSNALTCYTIGMDFVTSSNQYFPCGSGSSNSTSGRSAHQSCCYGGDICMADGICHYTHTVTNGTGYYMAGCTDPTWNDPSCPKACTSEYGADVVYSDSTEEWNCCVSTEAGSKDCQNPSNFTIQASSPESLSTIKHLTATPVPSSAALTPIGKLNITTSTTSSNGSMATISLRPSANATTTHTHSLKATSSSKASSSSRSSSLVEATTSVPTQESTTSAAPSSSSSSSAASTEVSISGLAIGLFALLAFCGGQSAL